jgi:hypothetical protein
VALDVVAAERLARPQGGLHVDALPERLRPRARFLDDVERERARVAADDRQADTVEADGVAHRRSGRAPHDEPAVVERLDRPDLAHESREHA